MTRVKKKKEYRKEIEIDGMLVDDRFDEEEWLKEMKRRSKILKSTPIVFMLLLGMFLVPPVHSASSPFTYNWTGFWTNFYKDVEWTLIDPSGKTMKDALIVQYSTFNSEKVKFDLMFDAVDAGSYTITMLLNKDLRSAKKISASKIDVDFVANIVTFDWSDTLSDSKVSSRDKSDKKFEFEFTRTASAGEHVVIDPYTIASGVKGEHYYQRHVQYMAGRYWVFYSDTVDAKYTSSENGVDTWSTGTLLAGITNTQRISTFWDGTYLHVACGYVSSDEVHYRRGVPASDGSITWSAVWQKALDPDDYMYSYFTEVAVSVDETGHAWIIANGESTGEKYLYAARNDNTDGTWSLDASASTEIDTATDTEGVPLCLSDGDVVVLWTPNSADVRLSYRIYDSGTDTWGSEVTNVSPTTVNDGYRFCAVEYDDSIHVVYQDATSSKAYYFSMSAGREWTNTATDLSNTAIVNTPTIVLDTASGIGVFWVIWGQSDNKIYTRHWDTFFWSAITTVEQLSSYSGGEVSYSQISTNFPTDNCALLYWDASGLYVEMMKLYVIDPGGVIQPILNSWGLADFLLALYTMVTALTAHIYNAITTLTQFIIRMWQFVYMLSTSIYFWFDKMVTMLIALITIIGDIINGTSSVQTGLGDLWSTFSFSSWVDFVPIAAFMYWADTLVKRAKQAGRNYLEQAIADLQTIMYLVSWVFDTAYTLFNIVMGVVGFVVGALTG